jgi:hypothetical protein
LRSYKYFGLSPFIYTPVGTSNACLIDSTCFAQAYLAKQKITGSWGYAKVIAFTYKNKANNTFGHAVCLFEYGGSYFIYDPEFGSFKPFPDYKPNGDNLDKFIDSMLPEGMKLIKINIVL